MMLLANKELAGLTLIRFCSLLSLPGACQHHITEVVFGVTLAERLFLIGYVPNQGLKHEGTHKKDGGKIWDVMSGSLWVKA